MPRYGIFSPFPVWEPFVSNLLKTALHAVHVEAGAKMVPFAGYDMPVQYPTGVLKEHLHTRTAAGLFDVSHMGQVKLAGEGVAVALEALVPVDVIDLPVNTQRYAVLTNANGGIIDDLMITNTGESLLLVVNAARKDVDIAHLRAQLPASVKVDYLADQSLLAIQGPKAREVMRTLVPELADLTFMQCRATTVGGIDCWVSCSGYTGEDGYEISVASADVVALAKLLLDSNDVQWIGLGARDSLRLEAGLCLYGHDIDEATTPIEASLLWSISPCRRPGGARAGGYPGAARIEQQIQNGCDRYRVMIAPEGRAPVRDGAALVDASGGVIGGVTSGGYGPSIEAPVAIGYIKAGADSESVCANVRNKHLPVSISKRAPFTSRYFRG